MEFQKPHYIILKNPPTTFKCGCRKTPIHVSRFDQHIKTLMHQRYKQKLNNIKRRYIKK